jgi:tocopherol O-methyltransferase
VRYLHSLPPKTADPRVVDWYEEKTQFLLEKYSHANRIHYHTGLFPPSLTPACDLATLRRQLWQSQEDMLEYAARLWNAKHHLSGRILDVGCGLGGGPLYWAEQFGAEVTALTPVPSHVRVISGCAAKARVSHLVHPVVASAEEGPGDRDFDAAVATGASNYFNRPRWFVRLATQLRPGGRVFIEDTFLGRPEMAEPFNRYWISNIGSKAEYLDAAASAGFRIVHEEDVTDAAAGFWRLSVAYSKLLLVEGGLSEQEIAERHRSIDWQTRVYEAYLDRGFYNLLLHFEMEAS